MKKLSIGLFVISLVLVSCGGKSTKKRKLDSILYKYASAIRWSNFDAAVNFLDPKLKDIKPTSFQLEKLKQFKVSRYLEAPITPGAQDNVILQDVEIKLYNIHNNQEKVIYDRQVWEFDSEKTHWFLTSGIPKI